MAHYQGEPGALAWDDAKDAADAAQVSRWAPATAYTAGQQVVSPLNDVVSAIASFTSGATFDPTKWLQSSTFGALAAANTFTQPQTITHPGAPSPAFQAGTGAARGAPTGTITAVTNGAGAVTSTTPGRKWAYTELDGIGGETPRSPASAALSLTAQSAKLTVPPIRPGMNDRVIYASDDNGTTWHKLGLFNVTGALWFGSVYLDNNAALAGIAPPAVDTTNHQALIVNNDGMVYLKRTDAVSDVCDLTILMANPAVAGSLSADIYGQLLVRAGGPAAMPCVTVNYAGLVAGSAFQSYYVPDDGVGVPLQAFRVTGRGAVVITGAGLDIGGPAISIAPTVAQTSGTGGLLAVTLPAASTNHGMVITNGGTGDTIRSADAKFRVLPDGTINASTATGTFHYLKYINVAQQIVHGAGGKVGLFGAAAVVQPTGTPAASTDLASVIALANSLRTSLLALGAVA